MANININFKKKNTLPIANLTFSGGSVTPLAINSPSYNVELDASTSTSNDGNILFYQYERRINNGNWTILTVSTSSFYTETITTTGVYEYRVIVIDDNNLQSEPSNILEVGYTGSIASAPVAIIGSQSGITEYTIEENQTMNLIGINSTDSNGINSYAWDVISSPINSSHVLNGQFSPNATLNLVKEGQYYISLTITNTNGASDTAFITINVFPINESGQIATNGDPRSATDNGCSRRYAGNFSAMENDVVEVTIVNNSPYGVSIIDDNSAEIITNSGTYIKSGSVAYDTNQMPNLNGDTLFTIQFENTTTPETSNLINISAEQTLNPC